MTVSPKPRPKTATADDRDGDRCRGRPAGHRHEGSRARHQPDQRHEPERDPADGEARHERADGGRGGEGAEHHLLLVRAAVEDPVDEDGRRRRWPWRTRSPSAARRAPPRRTRRWRNSRTSRNGSRRRSPPMTVSPSPTTAIATRTAITVVVGTPSTSVPAGLPSNVSADEPGPEPDGERDRSGQIHPGRVTRRLPAVARRPGEGERDDPDRDVDVEHPAPGRGQHVDGEPGRDPPAASADSAWMARSSAAPTNGPAAIPRKVSAPIDPERPRPGVAAIEVRGGGRARPG